MTAPEPTRDSNPVESLQRGWQLAADIYHALPPGFLPYLHVALAGCAILLLLWLHQKRQEAKARRAKKAAAARAKARKKSRRKPTNRTRNPRQAA